MRYLPPQCQLEASHGVVACEGLVVLLGQGELLDQDRIIQHRADLRVRGNKLINKHHLGIVVIKRPNLNYHFLNLVFFFQYLPGTSRPEHLVGSC